MVRLLVVEDFPPLAKGMVRALRRAGFDVACAASRAEVKHVEGWFDAAVVDLELPDANGIDVVADLRAQARVGEVVFFTACQDGALLERAAGIGKVVDKSAGVAFLTTMINKWLAIAKPEAMAVGRHR